MCAYSIKNCSSCGNEFQATGSRSMSCKSCAYRIARQKSNIANKKHRVKKYNSISIGSTIACKICNCNFVKSANVEHYCNKCKKVKHKTIKARKVINANMRKKHAKNPVILAKTRFRNILCQALRRDNYGKKSKANEVLGCSWEQFKIHIEKQFLAGMTWENKSKWAIDHIVPLASAKNEHDVLRLNHFTNLRPLWHIENRAKGAKVEHLI